MLETIVPFSTLTSTLPHRVLPPVECCLEGHTSILLHQCYSIILSPHCALTAPDCSLQAGRPLSVWSLFLCLTIKNSYTSTVDHSQCLRVLIVEQTVLTWHCMLRCVSDLSVHEVFSSGTWECVYCGRKVHKMKSFAVLVCLE